MFASFTSCGEWLNKNLMLNHEDRVFAMVIVDSLDFHRSRSLVGAGPNLITCNQEDLKHYIAYMLASFCLVDEWLEYMLMLNSWTSFVKSWDIYVEEHQFGWFVNIYVKNDVAVGASNLWMIRDSYNPKGLG